MRFPRLERWRRRPQGLIDVHAPLLSDADLAGIAAHVANRPGPLRLSTRQQRGEQDSPYRGTGLDFADLRPYQPGDDVRRIDWRVSARLQKPFVRLYAEPRQAVTWVVLDCGPSMRFGTRTQLKAAQAARLAALILGSAGRAHEALALTLLDGDAYTTPSPRSGRTALHAALEALRTACPPRKDLAPSRWNEVLAELELTLPPGARLWLLSDLLALTRADEALLERLAARAELTLVLVEDASERELPRLGRVHLHTPTGTLEVDTATPALRQAYAEARNARLARLERLAGRLRARLLPVGAEEALAVIATRLAQGT